MKKITLIFFLVIIGKIVVGQNVYLLNNRFDPTIFNNLHKKQANGSFSATPKTMSQSLKGYIAKLSDDKDTLFIEFWNIRNTPKHPDPHLNSSTLINSADNNSTFAYPITWGTNRYFSVPFKARIVTATSIPFRYRLKKSADLEADFLNVGVNFFFIKGKTKFYKQEQIGTRQSYHGIGPFVAFYQQKIDSSSTRGNLKEEKQVAAIGYGISVTQSWNSFSVLLAIGFDNAIGSNAQYWEENNFKYGAKPWIGFGFGYKLIDIEFKPTNKTD